jgi:hypothetical protein
MAACEIGDGRGLLTRNWLICGLTLESATHIETPKVEVGS